MENLYKNKKIIVICVMLIVVVLIIIILGNKKNNVVVDNTEGYNYLKKYGSNEYVPIYVTEEDMAKKYLNDYKNNMLSDIEEAYYSLNKEYREKKFINLDGYKEYIKNSTTLALYSMEVDKYNIITVDGYKAFNIFDKSGNQYIFKEISIMNYEVYLDDYTIKLK